MMTRFCGLLQVVQLDICEGHRTERELCSSCCQFGTDELQLKKPRALVEPLLVPGKLEPAGYQISQIIGANLSSSCVSYCSLGACLRLLSCHPLDHLPKIRPHAFQPRR